MLQLHLSKVYWEERSILAHSKQAAKKKLQHALGQLSHQFFPLRPSTQSFSGFHILISY